MSIPFTAVLLLLGALQGFILSGYFFWYKTDRQYSAYFLSLLLFVLSFDITETALDWSGIHLTYTRYFPFTVTFLVGPAIYGYTRTASNRERMALSSILGYFIPVLVYLFVSCALVVFVSQKGDWLLDSFHFIARILAIVFTWYCFYKSYYYYNYSWAAENKQDIAEAQWIHQWTGRFLVACWTGLAFWTITLLVVFWINPPDVVPFYIPIELFICFWIYWVSFTGFHQLRFVLVEQQNALKKNTTALPDAEIVEILKILETSMTAQKLYLDPDLQLTTLAQQIKIAPKSISLVLNQTLKTGFNEYINTFRVRAAQQKLLDPLYANWTIAGIAYESGFNSLATFQRVFKLTTGMTPKQYIAAQKK